MKTVGELKKVLRKRGLLQEKTEDLKKDRRRKMTAGAWIMNVPEAKAHMRSQKPIRASTG